jgi:hypothetical protein
MSDERFWSIVDSTTVHAKDPDRQLQALISELRKLPADEIDAYETALEAQLQKSHNWDLWGATYVVHGGASDDGFVYFRLWLISKGKRVFEIVSGDPDVLADLLVAEVQGVLEFEEFLYVAREIWGEKTGRDPGEMPSATAAIYLTEPSGQEFIEDAGHLSQRYPKLWRRFGNHPLG